jgi:hypothetical protein
VFTITRSGWLEISVNKDVPIGTTATIQIAREGVSEPTTLEIKAGQTKKISLKKGMVRVNASAGNRKSVDIVTIRGLKTTKLVAPKGEQRAIHKLGSDAQYCPMIVAGKLYSYNCTGEGQVYRHNALDNDTLDSREPVLKGVDFTIAQPTKNGLIGLVETEEDAITNLLKFANLETETLSNVPIPDTIEQLLGSEQPHIITSPDPDNGHFLIVFNRLGRAYLFSSMGDTNPIELKLPKNATLNDNFGITTFQFYGDRIVSYAGRTDATDIDDGGSPTEQESNYDNNIYEFDMSGKVITTIALAKGISCVGLDKVTDSFYALEQNDGLDFYHLQDGVMSKIFKLDDAAKPLVIDNQVYAQAGGVLYLFEGKEDGSFSLRSLFSSSAIAVSDLFKGPNGLIFTGYATRLDQPALDVYELLSTAQLQPPVEESINFESLQDIITSYDYDDTRIIFSLSSTGSGADYETLRSRLEAKLQSRGIDVGGRHVELFPLN